MGQGVTKDDWNSICIYLAQEFSNLRKQQFDTYISLLKEASPKMDTKINIVNDTVAGSALYAMQAHQVLRAMGIISSQTYISPEEGEDFADLLNAYICGENSPKCKDYFIKYLEASKDQGTLLFLIASDIAKYITNSEVALAEALILADPLVHYSLLVDVHVANAFKDEAAAQKVLEGIKKRSGQ